jgi:ankyrin repeat protein
MGFMEVVDLLVKNGANCAALTLNGTTALHYLCTHKYSAHQLLMLRPVW